MEQLKIFVRHKGGDPTLLQQNKPRSSLLAGTAFLSPLRNASAALLMVVAPSYFCFCFQSKLCFLWKEISCLTGMANKEIWLIKKSTACSCFCFQVYSTTDFSQNYRWRYLLQRRAFKTCTLAAKQYFTAAQAPKGLRRGTMFWHLSEDIKPLQSHRMNYCHNGHRC